MNSSTITVHWHDDNQPVYSVDFQPVCKGSTNPETTGSGPQNQSNVPNLPGDSPRLVTGGGDNNVRVWRITQQEDGKSAVEYLSSLTKHTQAVNVVRFNPRGDVLATAGDDGTVILWELSPTIIKEFGSDDDDDVKESWVNKMILRSSTSEIYDVSWSPNGKYLATGSMDHFIRIYNVENNGELIHQGNYHNHYIQGVAWDPLNEYLVSQSADRSISIIKLNYLNEQLITTNMANIKVSRCEVPINKLSMNSQSNYKTSLMYHSETLQSFFRRLAFSPDGSLLLTPLGVYRYDNDKRLEPTKKEASEATGQSVVHSEQLNAPANVLANESTKESNPDNNDNSNDNDEDNDTDGKETNTVFVYTRSSLNKPILHIPGFKKATIAISFSPKFYKNPTMETAVFKLPYKMIFAVATQDSIVIYDTVDLKPLGIVSNVHYSTITDLAWNKDGYSIIISSADGFCSTINFDSGVFGEEISEEEALRLLNELKKEAEEQVKAQVAAEAQAQAQDQVQSKTEPIPQSAPIQSAPIQTVPTQTVPAQTVSTQTATPTNPETEIVDVEMEPVEPTPSESHNTEEIHDKESTPSILNMLKKKDKQKKRITPTLVN